MQCEKFTGDYENTTKRAQIVKKNVAQLKSESGISASINLPRDIDRASKSVPL